MAFVHSKSSRILVNENHFSAKIRSVGMGHARAVSPVTALLDEGEKFIPGLRSGTLTLGGLFEAGTGSIHAEINASVGTDDALLVTAAPEGFAVGKPTFIAVGDITNYEVPASVSDAVGLQVDSEPDDGVDWGFSLHDLTAETTTGNSASVDNAASSANGGVATLHVTAASGATPSLTVKVQHSTDDSVWVDLITFTAATATTHERKTVAGTVNRYTRETHTISGTTPSFTYAAAFARR